MTEAKLALEYVPVGELRTYHRNARRGDLEEIKKSLRINGQYRAIVVNRGTHTGRENEVLAGNHTLMAARELGNETIAVTWVDLDDDQARRVVLADNRISDKATYDVDLLTAEIQALEDLEGTGYTQADLDKLLYEDDDDPADSEHEDEYNNRFELVVECEDEEQQRDLYQRFTDEGLKVRVLSL